MSEVIQGVAINGDQCVVVGIPDDVEDGHNCDAMGCSSIEHVLWRGKYENETPPTVEETFAQEVTDGHLIATLKAENERLRNAEALLDQIFEDGGASFPPGAMRMMYDELKRQGSSGSAVAEPAIDKVECQIKAATVNSYDHGGARVFWVDEQDTRHLIVDIYGDGQYRDFILKKLGLST